MTIRILALFLATFIGLNTVHASDPNDDGEYLPITDQTIEELQAWATLYWEWRETGVAPPEWETFQFSQSFPAGFHPFNDAWALFTEIYADQLDLNVWTEAGEFNPNGYSVVDLINDDPVVRQQFRQYTETGWLITSIAGEPEATQRHLLAILDALTDGEGFELRGEFIIIDAQILSEGLQKKDPVEVEPNPDPGQIDPSPQDIEDFHDDLKEEVDDSKLPWSPLYWGYPPNSTKPFFDCKDYGDALAEWLRRKLLGEYPDHKIKQLPVWWTRNDGKRTGHIVTIIYWNGHYWIVDAQTGQILGPFPAGTPIDVEPILVPEYPYPPGSPVQIDPPVNPGDRPWNPPVGPWWTNPDMWDWWRQNMPAECDPNDYVPDGVQDPNPPTPPV